MLNPEEIEERLEDLIPWDELTDAEKTAEKQVTLTARMENQATIGAIRHSEDDAYEVGVFPDTISAVASEGDSTIVYLDGGQSFGVYQSKREVNARMTQVRERRVLRQVEQQRIFDERNRKQLEAAQKAGAIGAGLGVVGGGHLSGIQSDR